MNKSVFISMLTLSIGLLAGMYILKIFFPQEFLFVIENERIIAVGEYIDGHAWLYYICCGITAFITYWLYCCACAGKKALTVKENICVLVAVILSRAVNFFDVNIATHISTSAFFILPLILKFNMKSGAIIFMIHGFAQILSLSIRSLPMYLTNVNFITTLFIGLESYFWLILFYIIYNYKKQEV